MLSRACVGKYVMARVNTTYLMFEASSVNYGVPNVALHWEHQQHASVVSVSSAVAS